MTHRTQFGPEFSRGTELAPLADAYVHLITEGNYFRHICYALERGESTEDVELHYSDYLKFGFSPPEAAVRLVEAADNFRNVWRARADAYFSKVDDRDQMPLVMKWLLEFADKNWKHATPDQLYTINRIGEICSEKAEEYRNRRNAAQCAVPSMN